MSASRASARILYFSLAAWAWGGAAWAGDWDGPSTGPPRQAGKTVIYLAHDMQNGGISGVLRAFEGAAQSLGWQISYLDGKGDGPTNANNVNDAVARHPDAIVLGGIDAGAVKDQVAAAKSAKIVLAGWHAVAQPGPTADLFVNVATDPVQVADAAAKYVIASAAGNVGAVLINDSRFGVAIAKTDKMKEIIEACSSCKVLSVEDVKISEAAMLIPGVVARVNAKFGKAWTHTLAINDIYFDNMNFPLIEAGRDDVYNVSAGDGSVKALSRIKTGHSQQIATVAEPLNLQGWQLADELNRAFAGQPPSGYVSKPIVVTAEFLAKIGTEQIDANIPYQQSYEAIWAKR